MTESGPRVDHVSDFGCTVETGVVVDTGGAVATGVVVETGCVTGAGAGVATAVFDFFPVPNLFNFFITSTCGSKSACAF